MSQVDFFNSIAEKWDSTIKVDEKKINKLLSQISITNGESILDIGTGTGVLIPFYKEINKNGKITGVDISEGMLNVAKRKFGQLSNLNFKLLDVENEFIEEKFDKIVLYSMFPHLNNKVETIKKLVNNNLNKNGKLLIAHSDSREFLNNLHSNADDRVSNDILIDVNKQKEVFEIANLKVINAYEDDEIYYLVIENV
jgi:demethylmenaquinone methyltransferase/2-methoxy-6-polyprenyl-1,4-benzoquinol methylase